MTRLIIKVWIFCLGISGISLAQNKTYICINEKGEELFSFDSRYVNAYHDGMAIFETVVTENNKRVWRMGFINKEGEIVIPAQYEKKYSYKSHFYEDRAWVRKPGDTNYTLIDKTGKVVPTKGYDNVAHFKEGLCAVYQGYNMGFIDKTGKEVIPCKYTGAEYFSEGLVCLCLATAKVGLYGFLDTKGQIAIPFKFKQAGFSSFRNGECRVSINGRTNLIDKNGKVVFTPKLTKNMESFNNGLASAYTTPNRRGFGFFNRQNKWIIKPVYYRVKSFKNGLSILEKNDRKKGVVDTLGNIIVPFEYDNLLGGSHNHLFTCTKASQSVYLNSKGKPFTNVFFEKIWCKNTGNLFLYKTSDQKYGYLNQDGTIAIEAKYSNATAFKEGKAWVQKLRKR